MNKLLLPTFLLIASCLCAQTPIHIPPLLTGTDFNLNFQEGSVQFLPGNATSTYGYNGDLLGPTLILEAGSFVTLNVANETDEMTSTHWHGLHIPAEMDGGPHQPIVPGQTWSPQFLVRDKAATFWYHPHMHESTNRQVTRGAAGMLIVRDAEEAALNLPRDYGVDDFPVIMQTKQFGGTNQISLNWTDNRAMVNGTIDGLLSLPRQVVRLRLLNANNTRSLNVGFSDNRQFFQIGTDGGLITAPKTLTRLMLSSGERAEILVDLTNSSDDSFSLRSYGNEMPAGAPGGPCQGGGGPCSGSNFDNNAFDLMEINVANSQTADPVTTIPAALAAAVPTPSTNGASNRTFTFQRTQGDFTINNQSFDMEEINFSTDLNKTEIWVLTNNSPWSHPFHVHGNSFFQLVNGVPLPERKDVILVPRNATVRIITNFEDFSDSEVPYMYHCHLLQHEDEGMMGHFTVLSDFEAGFGANTVSGCAPLTVSFTDESTGQATAWNWSFPGGSPSTSTAQNPTVTYNSAGNFSVSLSASNASGSSTVQQANYVNILAGPSANFTFTTNGPMANFTNASSGGNSFVWNFGDGTTSTQANSAHTYSGEGTFTVTLTVTGPCGTDSHSLAVTMNALLPTADFAPSITAGCAPLTVALTDQSTNQPTSWAWSFPGGSPAASTLQNPTVTYGSPGVYDISLTVGNVWGTSMASEQGLVTVSGTPVTAFDIAVNGNEAIFDNQTSQSGVGGIVSYHWEFGEGGSTSSVESPSHIYPGPGTYEVILTATNGCGSATYNGLVTILANTPFAAFISTATAGCAPLTVTFTDQSTGGPLSWMWMLPGATPGMVMAQNATVTYHNVIATKAPSKQWANA